ncbi:hypothetical protein COB57_06140 [Candidatus Peregrinibacteria bacterium]|nr:MAG: hypothetical protein COB57_06140 [Candidatus Peregrinibacteria bacterium]
MTRKYTRRKSIKATKAKVYHPRKRSYAWRSLLYRQEKNFTIFCFIFCVLFFIASLYHSTNDINIFYYLSILLFFVGILFGGMARYHSSVLDCYKTMSELRKMDPFEFEHYVGNLLMKHGFQVQVTQGSGDFGADIMASKKGKKYIVQVKRYAKYNKVSSPEMQKFLGSMKIYGVDHGIFVCTSAYTSDAMKIADTHKIHLVDEVKLGKMIHNTLKK